MSKPNTKLTNKGHVPGEPVVRPALLILSVVKANGLCSTPLSCRVLSPLAGGLESGMDSLSPLLVVSESRNVFRTRQNPQAETT